MSFNIKTIENDEKFLRQISTDVDLKNENYMDYIKEVKKYCQNNSVYALAPVQIGIPKRMIYFKNTNSDMTKNKDQNYDESIVLINPVLISAKGHAKFLERCASCLDYVGTVDRPYMVEVKYFDVDGNEKHEIFEGFKATVFCHEYDHLNGILHIDLAKDLRTMSIEDTRSYRNMHPYQVLSKDDEFKYDKKDGGLLC